MPRFFFHVSHDNALFEDKQGLQFPDLPAAWCWAVQDARVIASQQVFGLDLQNQWMEIGDETEHDRLSLVADTP